MCVNKVYYEILGCESKLLQIKTSTCLTFSFHSLRDFNFLKNAYVNEVTELTFYILC